MSKVRDVRQKAHEAMQNDDPQEAQFSTSDLAKKVRDFSSGIDLPDVSNDGADSTKSNPYEKYQDLSGEDLLEMFRNGDENLDKALNDTQCGPRLLMKIQDAMNAENRRFSLLSAMSANTNDMLKEITRNIRSA